MSMPFRTLGGTATDHRLTSMARRTGFAVLSTALLTVIATGIAFWSFHRFESTLSTVNQQVVPALTAALKLSEETAGLTGAAIEIAGVDDPESLAASRARQHALAGQALATLDRLKPELTPAKADQIGIAFTALLQSLSELAETVEQHVTLRQRHLRLADMIAHHIADFGAASAVLLYDARSLTGTGPTDDITVALSVKGEGSQYLIQLKAALDQTDAADLLDNELALRQTGVALRGLSGRLATTAMAQHDPATPEQIRTLLQAAQSLAFAPDGVFALRQKELDLATRLAAAVRQSRQRAATLQASVRQAVSVIEGVVADRRADIAGNLQFSRAQLAALCIGGLILAAGIAVSVTRAVARHEHELHTALDAAGAASTAKTEFLANMSHELRTPLNAIIGFAEILKREAFGPLGHDRYRDYVTHIESAGDHLLKIIGDILDLAKIETGRLELFPEAVAPGEAITSAVRLVELHAKRDGIRIAATAAADLPLVHADPVRLKQMLINLLSNAVKYSGAGGAVDVRAEVVLDSADRERPLVRFSVQDNGIGMAQGEISRALEPFARSQEDVAQNRGGTGLGLPLVARLVSLSGGKLTIDSARGRGTLVSFALPVASPRPGCTVAADNPPLPEA